MVVDVVGFGEGSPGVVEQWVELAMHGGSP